MRKSAIGVLCNKRNKDIIKNVTEYALDEIKKEVEPDISKLIGKIELNIDIIPLEIKQLILIYLINQNGCVQNSILSKSSPEFKENFLFGLNKLCTAYSVKRLPTKGAIEGARKLDEYVRKKIDRK